MSQQFSKYLADSYLYGSNAPYIEELYESYLNDPSSVSERWCAYFEGMQVNGLASTSPISTRSSTSTSNASVVTQLIQAYRTNGVLKADLDPLKLNVLRPHEVTEFNPEFYGLTDVDMRQEVDTSFTYFGKDTMPLHELIDALKQTYCGTLGVEYMYIRDTKVRHWWAERMESIYAQPSWDADKKKHLLERLTAAEGFESYLNTKYVGVKRFSLDGGDSFIVAMDELVRYSASKGVDEIVIGMAHRGRLNTLANILGKAPSSIFAEFEGTAPQTLSTGDVKYHNGFSSNIKTPAGTVHMSMGYNPSHLEVVSAVQSGSARARMDRSDDPKGDAVMAVTVHGDGAIIGQGIVQEIFSLAGTRGYYVGGSVRIVINNQVQFTTSDIRDSRTSIFCTDIARMIDMPVLHVNCDDPEAVALAIQLAVDFRQEFHRDVMLDLVCYRKLGHNEQDTPQITQPFMYKAIKDHPGSRRVYAQKLIDEGVIQATDEQTFMTDYRKLLEDDQTVSGPIDQNYKYPYATDWETYLGKPWVAPSKTGVTLKELKALTRAVTEVPATVKVHPLVQRVLNDRAAMGLGQAPIDWGMAENLAYASLVNAGVPVRLSGEDCGRGTFSHRQCIVHDQNRQNRFEDPYIPLQNVSAQQGSFVAIDSVLSENAVLGFEYGYSIARPEGLTVWEAQFGDFANGAQIIIDQFISSGETKWGQHSGVTLLLPHGFEGQGPEHSSARIERFLELSAEDNWILTQPTNAAQIFHLLRQQALGSYRKPLVVFSPKSLLRHKGATADLKELSTGSFQMVLPEADQTINAKDVKRLIICSGRLYYDLVAAREERKLNNIAIIRLEQLYPFPQEAIKAELKKYSKAVDVMWCQDEPENQGPWGFTRPLLQSALSTGQTLSVACRPACPAPATGYAAKHQEQLNELLSTAFGKLRK